MTIKHLFPPAWPALNLDFANSKALDPRITFTRSSIGTYVDTKGILQTAVEDEARFDHDPTTGESLGLLIEESRTNLVTTSNQAAPSGAATDVALNAATSPEGETNAMVWTAVGDKNKLEADVTFLPSTPNEKYAFSFFYKEGTATVENIAISATQGGAGKGSITFNDLNDGKDVSGVTNFIDYDIIAHPNGWKRIYCVFGNIPGTSIFSIRIRVNGAKDTETGFVFGIQAELGGFPTSLIPTAGSVETRSPDIAEIKNAQLSPYWVRNKWTAIWDFKGYEPKYGFQISNGGTRGDRSRIVTNEGSGLLNLSWQGGGPINGPAYIEGAHYRIGVSIDTDFTTGAGIESYAVNGEFMGSLNSTVETNRPLQEVRFYGDNISDGRLLNGHYARATLYKQFMSNQQLQALTA